MNAEYTYTLSFYNALTEEAELREIDGISIPVFSGKLVDTYNRLGIGQSYYSLVNRALRELGCVTLLRRGSRGNDTLLALHHPPDEGEFVLFQNRPLTDSLGAAKLSERLKAAEGRLDTIEKRLGGMVIVDAIGRLDERLTEVEAKVSGNTPNQTEQESNTK